MKSLLAAAFLFVSPLAFACPNLAGNYTCTGAHAVTLSLQQTTQGSQTKYTMDTKGDPVFNGTADFLVPQRWTEGGVAKETACTATNFTYTETGRNPPSLLRYLFDQTAPRQLHFLVTFQGENGKVATVADYRCRR